MNWNEMKKKAIENGFVFVKHGSIMISTRTRQMGKGS